MRAGTIFAFSALVVTVGATEYFIQQTGLIWEDRDNLGMPDLIINQGDSVQVSPPTSLHFSTRMLHLSFFDPDVAAVCVCQL